MGIPGEKGTEEVFKAIMSENFPKLMSDTKPQTQKAQRTPSRIDAQTITLMHIILQLQKIKEKILKETRENL